MTIINPVSACSCRASRPSGESETLRERTIGGRCAEPIVVLFLIGAALSFQPALADPPVPAEIIFAARQPGAGGHWYENFGYYAFDQTHKIYGAQGRLCRLNLQTDALTVLLDDPQGAVRDPQVHYDAQKNPLLLPKTGLGLLSSL